MIKVNIVRDVYPDCCVGVTKIATLSDDECDDEEFQRTQAAYAMSLGEYIRRGEVETVTWYCLCPRTWRCSGLSELSTELLGVMSKVY
jgi:hypothetical protein